MAFHELCFNRPVIGFSCFSSFCLYVQNPEPKDQISKMIKILSGEMAIELHLQFLIRNNNTDLMILKNTKVRGFVRYGCLGFI